MPLKVSTGLNQYDPVDGSRCGIGGRGLLRPNPTLQEPRQRGQPLLLEGYGPRAGGYELGWGFVWMPKPWIAYAAAGPKREELCCRSADGLPDPAGFLRQTVRGKIPNRAF